MPPKRKVAPAKTEEEAAPKASPPKKSKGESEEVQSVGEVTSKSKKGKTKASGKSKVTPDDSSLRRSERSKVPINYNQEEPKTAAKKEAKSKKNTKASPKSLKNTKPSSKEENEIDEEETKNGDVSPPAKNKKGVKNTNGTKATKKAGIDEESADSDSDNGNLAMSIYEFKATSIKGEEIPLEKYEGYVCLIVNVASRCGHTKLHYEQLVELYNKYKEKGLRILAFPCNQFASEEPGNAKDICEFAEKKNVTFDMFDKINVKGKNAHQLYNYLTAQKNGPKGKDIEWNFVKFLVDKYGNFVDRYEPDVEPVQMVEDIEKLL